MKALFDTWLYTPQNKMFSDHKEQVVLYTHWYLSPSEGMVYIIMLD